MTLTTEHLDKIVTQGLGWTRNEALEAFRELLGKKEKEACGGGRLSVDNSLSKVIGLIVEELDQMKDSDSLVLKVERGHDYHLVSTNMMTIEGRREHDAQISKRLQAGDAMRDIIDEVTAAREELCDLVDSIAKLRTGDPNEMNLNTYLPATIRAALQILKEVPEPVNSMTQDSRCTLHDKARNILAQFLDKDSPIAYVDKGTTKANPHDIAKELAEFPGGGHDDVIERRSYDFIIIDDPMKPAELSEGVRDELWRWFLGQACPHCLTRTTTHHPACANPILTNWGCSPMKANVNLPEGMGSPNTQAEALRNDDKEVAAQQSKPWIHTLTLFPGMTIPEIERAINEWMVPHPIAQCHRFIDDIKQAISLIESCAGPS